MTTQAATAVDLTGLPTVYECAECGEQTTDRRCPDCNLFTRRLGAGGHCPSCDELILIQDMITTQPARSTTGSYTDNLTSSHLTLIDQHTAALDELTARIEVVIEPFRRARELIVTVPGISTALADIIIAETGADMTRFPTAGHLVQCLQNSNLLR